MDFTDASDSSGTLVSDQTLRKIITCSAFSIMRAYYQGILYNCTLMCVCIIHDNDVVVIKVDNNDIKTSEKNIFFAIVTLNCG